MQHVQFIMTFVIRNRYCAIKLKIVITVCVRLKKSIFSRATVSQIVPVTNIIHLLPVICHTTGSTTTDHKPTDREQRRLAENCDPKYIFTIPNYSQSHLAQTSLCDEMTVTKSVTKSLLHDQFVRGQLT